MRTRSAATKAGLIGGGLLVSAVMTATPGQAWAAESTYAVEAEQLVEAGRALASAGVLHAQAMQEFGSGWSGDAQLFWTAPAAGAVLDLQLEVPEKSQWEMDLEMTLAPDYGQIRFQVDGELVVTQLETFNLEPDGKIRPQMLSRDLTWSGYARSVSKGAAFRLPGVWLEGGKHRLSILVVGKEPQSTGYFVGIDRLVFHRMPAPSAAR